MFETKKLTKEKIEQRRQERRAVKRANQRRKITRHCCNECGQPKHYICLEHNQHLKKPFLLRLPQRIRYYSRKFYFNLVRRFGFVN